MTGAEPFKINAKSVRVSPTIGGALFKGTETQESRIKKINAIQEYREAKTR